MPHPTEAVAVLHPETGLHVGLDPAVDYPNDDPLVKEYPWAFAPRENAGKIVESVEIEDASADPGRKRRVNVNK